MVGFALSDHLPEAECCAACAAAFAEQNTLVLRGSHFMKMQLHTKEDLEGGEEEGNEDVKQNLPSLAADEGRGHPFLVVVALGKPRFAPERSRRGCTAWHFGAGPVQSQNGCSFVPHS